MSDRSSTTTVDYLLLERYVSGRCTSEERALVERWIADDPAHAVAVDEARFIWQESGQALTDVNAGSAWVSVRRALAAPQILGTRDAGRHQFVHRRWMGLAAGIVLAVCTMTAWYVFHLTPAPQPFREFVSAEGGRMTVTLHDGSVLLLGPATQLRVPNDFGISSRTVELTGEARFAVVHDAAHPFAVRTTRGMVRDVGTVFVVRDYPDDEADRVAVSEGEVALDLCRQRVCLPSSSVLSLSRGDLATIADTGAVVVQHGAKLDPLTAWMQGALVFDETPLRQVVRDISRTYQIKVTVEDSTLLTRRITATLTNQPLDLALAAITEVVGARFERTGNAVVIRVAGPSGTPSPAPRPAPLTTARVELPSHD